MTVIKMLKAVVKKKDSMHEQKEDLSREMEAARKDLMKMLGINYNRGKECL